MRNLTNFQTQVYNVVSTIPAGKVTTYKLVHLQLISKGIKSSPIAVGQALRRNPFGFLENGKVPCHRVVSTNLYLNGFYGNRNSEQKLKLLLSEGVQIKNGRVEKGCVYNFE